MTLRTLEPAMRVPTSTRLAEEDMPGLGGFILDLSRLITEKKRAGRSFDSASTRIPKHSRALAWGFPGQPTLPPPRGRCTEAVGRTPRLRPRRQDHNWGRRGKEFPGTREGFTRTNRGTRAPSRRGLSSRLGSLLSLLFPARRRARRLLLVAWRWRCNIVGKPAVGPVAARAVSGPLVARLLTAVRRLRFLLPLGFRARSRRPRSSGGASLAPSTALTVAVTRPAGPFRAPGTFRTTRTARSFGTVTGTRATGSKGLPRAVGATRFTRALRALRTRTRASGTVPSTATRSRSGGTRGLTVAV